MSRLNAMRLTVSSTRYLKKMDQFSATFDKMLDKEKQQGSEMLNKNLTASQHAPPVLGHGLPVSINVSGDTTVPVLSDAEQIQSPMATANPESSSLNPSSPSALTREKGQNCSPTDAAVINPSNGSNVVVDNWDLRRGAAYDFRPSEH